MQEDRNEREDEQRRSAARRGGAPRSSGTLERGAPGSGRRPRSPKIGRRVAGGHGGDTPVAGMGAAADARFPPTST